MIQRRRNAARRSVMRRSVMRRIKTLRFRFALWVIGLLVIVLIAFGAFMYVSLAQGLFSSIDDSLQLSATQAIAAVNIENGAINFSDSIPEETTANLQARGLTIRVLDATGQVIQAVGPYRSLPVDGISLRAAQQLQPAYANVPGPGHETVRFYTAPILDNQHVIGLVQVAQSLAQTQRTLDQLLAALLIGGPLLIVMAGLGGYFLAARALDPIDRITRTARHIAEGGEDLSARLNLPAIDDEVGRLASTFDAMLAKLDESFQRERQFTADASHELRTPPCRRS
jgi:signal transduction histidine kinase